MPKVKPLIDTSIVLTQLETLSGLIQLIPEQASMLLGISTNQLEDNRREGRPPAFTKQGGAIRYQLGTIRDYLKSKPSFTNDGEAFEYAKKNAYCFASFPDFMERAGLTDEWPFLVLQNKPVDLFASLSLPVNDDCKGEWFTLEKYCAERVRCEKLQSAEAEGDFLLKGFNLNDFPEKPRSGM